MKTLQHGVISLLQAQVFLYLSIYQCPGRMWLSSNKKRMLIQESVLKGVPLSGDDPRAEGDGPYRTNEASSVRKKYGEGER
jgi:hypothetical protein